MAFKTLVNYSALHIIGILHINDVRLHINQEKFYIPLSSGLHIMNKYTKRQEEIVKYGIPCFTFLVTAALTVFDHKYYQHVFMVGGGFLLLILLVVAAFRFLEIREKRWICNGKKHTGFDEEITIINQNVKRIERKIDEFAKELELNTKVNKLELRMNRIEKKRPK